MAKKPAKKKDESGSGDDAAVTGKVKSARGLLMAAIALSAASLGGGFFLARMAFQNDAEEFEPEYVETAEAETEKDDKDKDEAKAKDKDTGKEKEKGKDGEAEDVAIEGILEFDDITTDITSYDQQGGSVRSFLKLSLILVYKPEPGARELIEERQPFMRDLFTTYARSLTEPEVRGAAGILTVKSEMLKRARAATGNSIPQDVLIRDMIVQ